MIAIIPARAGSKRIPRKNAKEFKGQPLFLWAAQAAADSGVFDKIVISSDDPEILLKGNYQGFYTEYRLPEFCTDHVQLDQVMQIMAAQHADDLCLVYCNPFTRAANLRDGFKMFVDRDCVHVTAMSPRRTASSALEWVDAGQFSYGKNWAWAHGGLEYGPECSRIAIPSETNVDINTPEDWALAEDLWDRIVSKDRQRLVAPIKDWHWPGTRQIASNADSRG